MHLFFAAALFVLSAVPLAWSCAVKSDPVLRLCDGKIISFPGMVEEIRSSSAVFVGEGHTTAAHHKAQLDVVEALAAQGNPVTVALEMFYVSSQKDLDAWVCGHSTQEDFIRTYYRNWNVPWHLYRDIFQSARRNRIPLLAINIPREIVGKVYKDGFKSLSPRDKEALPPGISCNIDDTYRKYVREVFHMHSSRDDRSFNNFCEAQMVWNKGMAWHVGEYLKKNPGRTVVVLTGLGHAVKSGIPRQLQEFYPNRTRVVLPELTGATKNGVEEGDYLYLPATGKKGKKSGRK